MEILLFIIGLAAGSVITCLIMGPYHKKARKQLFKKVAELQDLNYRMLRKMEEAGLIKWNRNRRGHIIGLEINSGSDRESTENDIEDRTLH